MPAFLFAARHAAIDAPRDTPDQSVMRMLPSLFSVFAGTTISGAASLQPGKANVTNETIRGNRSCQAGSSEHLATHPNRDFALHAR